ncbi:MAG TPA: hypothetical protein VL426_01070 [Candidatus Binatia bacterium]|nr:hypothetical protein [Candidatus Binatia bacterium]
METPSAKPEPAATEPVKAPEVKPAKPAKAKKKRGGCLRSCLLFFLVLFLVLGALAAWLFRVPQKLGWIKGPGAALTEQVPERAAATELLAEAEAAGFKAKGVQVYVLPKPDSDAAMLYAVYDFSKPGVELSRKGPHQPVIDALELLGGGAKAEEMNVTHVGAEFRDEKGNLIMVVAAATADVRALRAGTMTEDEFKKKMGVRVDLPNYVGRAVIPF